MQIGQKLKNARTASGLTQEAAAEGIGVSRQTVSNWENNRSYPDIVSVLKLSQLYGISLDELLTDGKQDDRETGSIHFLEKHWERFYNAAVIMLPLSRLVAYFGIEPFAMGLQILGLLLFSLPRILFARLFGGGIRNAAVGIAGWCLCMTYSALRILWHNTSIWAHLLFTAGLVMIIYARLREQTCRPHRHRWLVSTVIAVCTLIIAFSGTFSAGRFNQADPFGHTYRVEEILFADGEQTPLVQLDVYNNFYLCTDRESYEFTKLGVFTYVQRAEGDQENTLKGIWQLIPAENGKALYKLTVDAEDRLVLSYTLDDLLQWKYQLSRVDTLVCQVATTGQQSSVYPDWFFTDTFSADLKQLSGGKVIGEGSIVFAVSDEAVTQLRVIEQYYYDGKTDSREHILTGDFVLPVSTRYEAGRQYALYRIPYQNGEYVFYVEYS